MGMTFKGQCAVPIIVPIPKLHRHIIWWRQDVRHSWMDLYKANVICVGLHIFDLFHGVIIINPQSHVIYAPYKCQWVIHSLECAPDAQINWERRAINLQERTGSSQISHDLMSEQVSVSQRKMFPEYLNLAISLSKYIRTPTNNSAERTHGSVGCKSTHFTRSDLPPAFERRCMNLQHPYRAESRFLISNLLQDDILERLNRRTEVACRQANSATASCVDMDLRWPSR